MISKTTYFLGLSVNKLGYDSNKGSSPWEVTNKLEMNLATLNFFLLHVYNDYLIKIQLSAKFENSVEVGGS